MINFRFRADVSLSAMTDFVNSAEVVTIGLKYSDYLQLIDRLLADGKTTGTEQSPELFDYARLNRQRMKRLDKTFVLNDELHAMLEQLEASFSVLVLTEGWCGDAAQNLPLLNAVCERAGGKLQVYHVLRDEQPALMDAFLTNGARSIPKVVFFETESGKVREVWGPRPEAIQQWFLEKKKDGDLPKEELSTLLHAHYQEDAGSSFQVDFGLILKRLLRQEG